VAADMNGDGHVDLASADAGAGTLSVVLNVPGYTGDFSGTVSGNIFGTISGNGAGLTNLNASQLTSGTIPLARIPAIYLTNVIGTLPASTTYVVAGNQTGAYGTPVLLVTNINSSASAAPALRLVGYGDTGSGVLSVSAQGAGLIAQFGNSNAFVSSLDINGNWTATTFSPSSDRSIKANFKPVIAQEILAKVAALPISRWNFTNSPGVPHMGPMAQDFYQVFNVGADDRHIATVDEDGVALAAIQGLNQKLEEQAKEAKAKDAEIESLQKQLSELETVVKSLQK
jgi:hypothetical protein